MKKLLILSLAAMSLIACHKKQETMPTTYSVPAFANIELSSYLPTFQEAIAQHKAEIEFPDFDKVELRVGEIIKCEKHPDADKILVFQVDFGGEVRQIISGVANSFKPEDCVGQHVVAVVNLKPRMLRGLESNGMLIYACSEDGKFKFVETKADNGVEVG